MTDFRCLNAAMAPPTLPGQPPRWSDIMLELLPAISSPPTSETERVLLGIVRFEGRLRLTVSSDMPHSMPPEDMLKSLAIQALARWTGLAYLHEMQRIQLTTPSSSLSSLVRDVIQKARETRRTLRRFPQFEEIVETGSEIVLRPLEEDQIGGMVKVTTEESIPKTVLRPLKEDQGMSFLPGHRFRVRDREPELVC